MEDTETEITVGPEATSIASTVPKNKPAPKNEKLPVRFVYHPSPDGVDENLLIMLHGLGDTEAPFANLGRNLRLPQTAILALRAPSKIPYLYEDAFQWYESFDPLGELLASPNPTPALDVMDQVLDYLISSCSWPPERIHLFGYAQGGSVAAEIALRRWKASVSSLSPGSSNVAKLPLGSIVAVDGPLLSYPTLKPPCAIPALYCHHSKQEPSSAVMSFRKGFSFVNEVQFPGQDGMPRNKGEWDKIVTIWSRMLSSRLPEMEGLYPVLSGGPSAPPAPAP